MRIGRTTSWLIYGIYLVVLVEGLSYLLISLANTRLGEPIRRLDDIYAEQTTQIRRLLAEDDMRTQLHPVFGWRYRPGFQNETDTINEAGLRSPVDYALEPAAGKRRVAVFGDSFVYGSEVADAESWPAQLEAMSDDLDVLNYGVPGYGTDQAYLRYEHEGDRYSPDHVVIGFAPVNLRRVVNLYRRFISTHEAPLVKPRFVLDENGELLPVHQSIPSEDEWLAFLDDPDKIREWRDLDYWYAPAIYDNPLHDISAFARLSAQFWTRLSRRYLAEDRLFEGDVFNTESEAFRLEVAVLEALVDRARERGQSVSVLMLPDLDSVVAQHQGRVTIYAPLVDALRERGIEVWDSVEAFEYSGPPKDEVASTAGSLPPVGAGPPGKAATVESLFAPGQHYSPEGNARLARWLHERLRRTDGVAKSRAAAGETTNASETAQSLAGGPVDAR